MSDVRPRIRLPRSASAGETITVKTLISHIMESGQRRDSAGNIIPRQIINRFTCEFAGTMVLDMQLHGGVSANPYVEFDAVVPATGDFVFTWYDDNGSIYTATETMTVG